MTVDQDVEVHRCERCGYVVSCTWGTDPFLVEIEDDETEMWLCEDCYQESADGI